MTGEGSGERNQEWEFADPWGTDEGSAAALAVTRRVGDVVMLLQIWVSDGAPAETIRLLVQQLVAVLRRTDASMVCSSVDDAAVREELLAAGFVPLPGELGAEPEADHPAALNAQKRRVSANGPVRRGESDERPARDGG